MRRTAVVLATALALALAPAAAMADPIFDDVVGALDVLSLDTDDLCGITMGDITLIIQGDNHGAGDDGRACPDAD